ncbi:type 2 DNA topoisomerase 6 subunit B-like isoform X2 [Nymphaea colorata]|uniref:type 2 DNA topoisomerase 6 subunit B-like isoform X2 n=1 Tax=Nymphaea colorata TaxID=210225 RepID=UPI00129DAA29|nr:type 2 DNA topoisomerase 6 subunit B-like isoform X2 [Nymphaea colorata]
MASSSTQTLYRFLINSAIQRCRSSNRLCRVSIVVKRCLDLDLRISVSDTGDMIDLSEFQVLGNHEFCGLWDGVLSIATTDVHEKEIYNYRVDAFQTTSASKFVRLPSTLKKSVEFSGTDVSLTTKDDKDICVAWMMQFCRKMLILKIPSITVELIVEHMVGSTSSDTLVLASEGVTLPLSTSNIERLSLGMEDYVFKHRNSTDMGCWRCYPNRENLKIGTGLAYEMENLPNDNQMVEAVIVVATVPDYSESDCSLDSVAKVLYFENFVPCSMPTALLGSLARINWKDYGLAIKSHLVDDHGDAVIEWENLQPFTTVELALHCYHKKVKKLGTHKKRLPERSLVKNAMKLSLDDLKAKYPGLFLSPHAVKIKKHVPELSRTIAGLILSSNDDHFTKECAVLLGIQPSDLGKEGRVESCVRERIMSIIEMNDINPRKRGREEANLLFHEGGGNSGDDEGECLYENDYDDASLSQSRT